MRRVGAARGGRPDRRGEAKCSVERPDRAAGRFLAAPRHGAHVDEGRKPQPRHGGFRPPGDDNIRFASRATKGVKVFTTAEGEKVVSVERISEPQEDVDETAASEAGTGEDPAPHVSPEADDGAAAGDGE